jgi:uncharacterized protein YeeX (DUF496 family)
VKNKIYSLVALIIFGSTSFAAQSIAGSTQEVSQNVQLNQTGVEMIESLRQSYESHSYDAFLASLQDDYEKIIQGGNFDEFIKMREIPPVDEKLKEIAAHWETIHQKLISERNDELTAAVVDQSDSAIFKRVNSIVASLPADQKEALQYLTALRFKTPSNASNDDEKKLIEIDVVSEFKIVHLDAQYAQKPFEDRFEKHVIIGMDMIHQMREASKSFKDTNLQKKVELAAAGFDAWQARNWDLNLLNQIVKKPTNDVEKKIASIFSSYRMKKDDLYQKEFLAKLDRGK